MQLIQNKLTQLFCLTITELLSTCEKVKVFLFTQ